MDKPTPDDPPELSSPSTSVAVALVIVATIITFMAILMVIRSTPTGNIFSNIHNGL